MESYKKTLKDNSNHSEYAQAFAELGYRLKMIYAIYISVIH